MKEREFDCDTCRWFKNSRCTNLHRSTYYPCPEWLRRMDLVTKDSDYVSIKNQKEDNKPIKVNNHD